MRIELHLVLALLIAVPCVIATVKSADAKARIFPVLTLLAALAAVGSPMIQRQLGSVRHLGDIAWSATGILAVIAGVRLGQPVSTTLLITGGVLGALLQLGIVVV